MHIASRLVEGPTKCPIEGRATAQAPAPSSQEQGDPAPAAGPLPLAHLAGGEHWEEQQIGEGDPERTTNTRMGKATNCTRVIYRHGGVSADTTPVPRKSGAVTFLLREGGRLRSTFPLLKHRRDLSFDSSTQQKCRQGTLHLRCQDT